MGLPWLSCLCGLEGQLQSRQKAGPAWAGSGTLVTSCGVYTKPLKSQARLGSAHLRLDGCGQREEPSV